MGKLHLVRLEESPELFTCAKCGAHFCSANDVVSKNFQGKNGKAFLVARCDNVALGAQENKVLMTGLHIVRDAICVGCNTVVGWSYDYAHDEKERYKTLKFVIERIMFDVKLQTPCTERRNP